MADPSVLKQVDERIQELDEEIQELALDGLTIPKITPDIKGRLDKVAELIGLSFNNCGLESLDNLPNGAGLIRLELKENKFKATELPKVADKYPKLQILFLSDNNITDYKELQPLTKLKEIVQLELNNTALSKKPDYRSKIFEMFSALEILDDLDKNGEPYEFDEDEEGEDYDEDEDEEGGSDYDEDDDEEEYQAKGSKKKTKK